MKQALDEHNDLAQLVYHNDKRAVSAFHKRLSEDADRDAFDALAADHHYMVHIDWRSPDYASIVSDIRKLKQCSGLAINWNELKKLTLWLDQQEREAGDYWSVSFVKMVASVLGRHGIAVLLVRDTSDPDWAAITVFPRDGTRLVKKLFGRLFGELDITWCIASTVGWDAPAGIRKEIQRRSAEIAKSGG